MKTYMFYTIILKAHMVPWWDSHMGPIATIFASLVAASIAIGIPIRNGYKEKAKPVINLKILNLEIESTKTPRFVKASVYPFNKKKATDVTRDYMFFNLLKKKSFNSRAEFAILEVANKSSKEDLIFGQPHLKISQKGLFRFSYTDKEMYPLNFISSDTTYILKPGESIRIYYPSFGILSSLYDNTPNISYYIAQKIKTLKLPLVVKRLIIKLSSLERNKRNYIRFVITKELTHTFKKRFYTKKILIQDGTRNFLKVNPESLPRNIDPLFPIPEEEVKIENQPFRFRLFYAIISSIFLCIKKEKFSAEDLIKYSNLTKDIINLISLKENHHYFSNIEGAFYYKRYALLKSLKVLKENPILLNYLSEALPFLVVFDEEDRFNQRTNREISLRELKIVPTSSKEREFRIY